MSIEGDERAINLECFYQYFEVLFNRNQKPSNNKSLFAFVFILTSNIQTKKRTIEMLSPQKEKKKKETNVNGNPDLG